jgi:tripartite-type tricarboxylate transporter receptor subunit TctC
MRKLLCLLTLIALPALAQDYPSRPVRFVNGFTQGGGSDLSGRIFADRLTEMWKQQVIVENKPGAGGSISADHVHKSPADGYTVLIFANTHLISQVVYPNVAVDMMSDFVPIALVTNAPLVVAVNPSKVAAKNLRDFTAMLRAEPGKHAYTACNVAAAPHFAMEIYKNALGLNALHVPHKGCGPATTDLVAGHIGIGAITLATALPFIRQGKLQPIALLSAERSVAAPEIPTMRDSGIAELKTFGFENYYGFAVHKNTPPAIVQQLEAAVLKAAAMPDLRKRVEGVGIEMFVRDAKAMHAMMRADLETLVGTAKAMNIRHE